MYTLILTEDELSALRWNGYRYYCGDALIEDLQSAHLPIDTDDGTMFCIPEHIAWDIREALSEETEEFSCSFPNIGGTLEHKLMEFVDSII